MKKRFVTLLIASVLVLSSCGNSSQTPSSNTASRESEESENSISTENNSEDAQNEVPETTDTEPSSEVMEDTISVEPIYEEGSPQKELQDYAVNVVIENYTYTDIDLMTINENLGTDEDGDYIILARLTWNQKNGASTTEDVLTLYSNDFAARIGMDQTSVVEIAIFWTIPYLDNATAKRSYERKGEGMYLSDNVMSSVFSEQ